MPLLVEREIGGEPVRARVLEGPAPVLELPKGRAIRVIVQGDDAGHLDLAIDPLTFGDGEFQALIRAVDLREDQGELIKVTWPGPGDIRARLELTYSGTGGDYAVVHTQANGWAVAVFSDLEAATAALAHFASRAELWHRPGGRWHPLEPLAAAGESLLDTVDPEAETGWPCEAALGEVS
jgi:hypothetical protein